MALKDIWQDLEDAVAGVENSGSDISVKPINDIAHAVIKNEKSLLNKLSKDDVVNENKLAGYTEEEKKRPISVGVWDTSTMQIISDGDALAGRVDKLEAQVGDFDTALDTAIALCDGYIGGEAE